MSDTGEMQIGPYQPEDGPAIRALLERIGWDDHYIMASLQNAVAFSSGRADSGVFIARQRGLALGFLFVQHYAWNNLAQIQGLAVDPSFQRQGLASRLVARAEEFARERGARGIYVDTPAKNSGGRRFYEAIGYRFGYEMPRYYEDELDGVTYQKFFS